MKAENTYIRLLLAVILGLGGLSAQRPAFDLDVGLFRADGNRSRLEVYLGIDRREQAQLAGVVMLKRRGRTIDYREVSLTASSDRSGAGSEDIIPQQATFTIDPGKYEVQVVLEDRQGSRFDSTITVNVPSHRRPSLGMSTVQLAGRIRPSGRSGEFVKRGLAIMPSPGATYHTARPLLWYYAEVYGLTPQDTVEVDAGVWRDSIRVIDPVTIKTPSPSMTYGDWGAFNVSSLAEGEYRLVLAAVLDGDTARAEKSFQVVAGPPVPADTGDVLAALPDPELADFARGLSQLDSRLDMKRYQAGNRDARNRMVRDAAQRVQVETTRDTTDWLSTLLHRWPRVKSYEPGWRVRRRLSPQARTWFLYGPPATIETYPLTNDLREYHIWTYAYADSTHRFVFLDREGVGEFTLMHATIPWEVHNENWQREVPWVFVPLDTTAVPAVPAAPVEETVTEPPAPEAPPVEPALADTLVIPEQDTVQVAPETPPVEPAPADTLIIPEQDTVQVAPAMDTTRMEFAPADTTAADTAAGVPPFEPAVNDTTQRF